MIIAGDVRIGSDKYALAIKTLSKQKMYYLFSTQNLNDVDNFDKILSSYKDLADVNPKDYLIGVYSKSLVTGKVKAWGECDAIRIILDGISYANNFTFLKEDVLISSNESIENGFVHTFEASNSKISYAFRAIDGEKIFIKLSYNVISLQLQEFKLRLPSTNLQLHEISRQETNRFLVATIKTIRRSDLDNVLDMSWYHVGDKVLKNYSNVKNVYDFETKVMTPIIKYAIKCHGSGELPVISLDTETTGLNTVNLAVDNPSRSHCVSIQLSWEDDQGVAIFNDMEHFTNVDIHYVMKRLGELFTWYKGERTIEYWELPEDSECDSSTPQKMNLFNTDNVDSGSTAGSNVKSLSHLAKKSVTVQRDWFFLIGHNFPFDRRTCYQTDNIALWFNADTLQMAFDLNPQTVRGNSKLKLLTRKLFGHETPELTDILGRGNEDKYRYLVDEEVANIYGCADVDYTRKLFFALRKLMPDSMWHYYLKQDVDLSNILAISEYYGMMTYPDKVVNLANETAENINILKEAAYSYVGAYQDYTSQRVLIESAYMSGMCSEEEYNEKINNIHVDSSATYHFEFKAASLIQVLYEILHYPIIAYTDGKVKKPKVDKYVMKKLVSFKRTEHSDARKLEKDILCYGADRAEYEALKNGSEADQKKAEGMCLISADKFNKLEYPLALLLQQYASLNKEYTSYYKPILTENLEGKLFKSYNMARIETRRIANPGQTMKANLKALVRSYDDDHYVLDFDMSQVEYRIMLSLAGFTEMVDKMKNPERDYHTETASMVNAKPAYKITKYERKHSKSVSFGVPYGLGDRSLCETMHGDTSSEHMVDTRVTLDKWKKRNAPIMELLGNAREEALEEWYVSDDYRNFIDAWEKDKKTKQYLLDDNGNKIPVHLGRVTNKLGFYRLFNLDNIGQTPADKARRAKGVFTADESGIRRKAGNFPIQSFAAEVYRTILTRFYWRCVQEGIEDKVIWHMLIHDELLASVHKSLHPMYIYKLVKESCMITMKGHTKYFVGINIGDTWAECKDDAREAPVFFVDRMIKKWDNGDFSPEKTDPKFLKNGDPKQGYWFDHPWDFIKPLREQYVQDRIGEVIRSVVDIDNGPIDVPSLLQKFDNYTVRAYVNDYPLNGKVDKERYRIVAAGLDSSGKPIYDEDKFYDAMWGSRLESWALTQFPEGKEIIDSDGNHKQLHNENVNDVVSVTEPEDATTDSAIDAFDDLDEIDALDHKFRCEEADDSYWSFDDEQFGVTYERSTTFEQEDYDITMDLDLSVKNAKSVNDLLVVKSKYETLQLINHQLRIPYITDWQLTRLKKYLAGLSCTSGYQIVFKDPIGNLDKWICITDKVDLNTVDAKVTEICKSFNKKLVATS